MPGPPPLPPSDASDFAAVEVELRALVRGIGLLGVATPRDAHLERARLLEDYRNGRERPPRWVYDAPTAPHAHRLRRLDALDGRLRALDGTPLGRLYQARAGELRADLEATLAVGTAGFARRALARFPPSAEEGRARELAARWCREPPPPTASPLLASDDRSAASLLSRLRAEVARQRLPFRVETSPSMSALAAISGDTLWVAEGRLLSTLDVERTVIHEIEAHALPRARAAPLPCALFAIGTAGGSDDQEGYGLWLEERRGVSGPGRRRELGARHEAVMLMQAGGDFVAVVRALRGLDVPLEAALRVTERAFRGSHGASPGLGRERVYIEALVRVADRLARCPGDERVLASGQVAVDAIDALRPWATAAGAPPPG